MNLTPAQIKQHFFEDNNHYTEVDASGAKVVKGFKDINGEEEEVWLLQCPKGFDVQQLEGHKIKLPGRTKVKDYETTALESTAPETLAFGYSTKKHKYDVKLLPIAGRIVLGEQITAPQNVTEESLLQSRTPTSVPMPEYIKLRHPLLGANFDEHLKSYASRAASLANGSTKITVKSEEHSNKRKQTDDLGKKSKSASSEKRKKLSPSKVDVSEDLKWLKEI